MTQRRDEATLKLRRGKTAMSNLFSGLYLPAAK